jgi:hypothetical protein
MTTNGLFPESQAERNQFHEWFKQQWQAQVGQYFETPDDLNCFDWYRIAGWDEQVLMQALDGLKRRTRHSFEAGREYEHAMSFTTAIVINRVKEKYGRICPHLPDKYAKRAA